MTSEQRSQRGNVDTSTKGSPSPVPKASKFVKTFAESQHHIDAVSVGGATRRDRLAELNLKEEDLIKLEKGQQEGHIKTDLYEYQGEYVRHGGQTLKHGYGTLRLKTKTSTTSNKPASTLGSALYVEEYKGQWWLDRRQGEGIYRFASGAVYRGQWENGLAHGFGQLLFPHTTAISLTMTSGNNENDSHLVPSSLHRKRKTSTETPLHHHSTTDNKSREDIDTDDELSTEKRSTESRSGGSKDDSRVGETTTSSSSSSSSSSQNSAPYDFWSNGVAIRVANTHFFAHVDPHSNTKQQQLRALEGLYVNLRLELLKEWEALWKFAERPAEGIYTSEYFFKVQAGFMEPTLRGKLLDFCMRWYRDLTNCEFIVLLPDLEGGYFLTFDQVITKSDIPKHFISLFVRREEVTEPELLKLFELTLCGDKKHHQQLVNHLKSIVCQKDNNKFADRIGEVVMSYALPVGPELNFTHAALREAERRMSERRDAQKLLGAPLAVTLLRLYRLCLLHLPNSEKLHTLTVTEKQQLHTAGDAQEKKVLSELHDRLKYIFVEYHIDLLWRVHQTLQLLQTETFSKSNRILLSRLAKELLSLSRPAVSVLTKLAQSLSHNEGLLNKLQQLGGGETPTTTTSSSSSSVPSLGTMLHIVWDIITGHDKTHPINTTPTTSSSTTSSSSTTTTTQESTDEDNSSLRRRRKSILEGIRISHPLTRPSRIGFNPFFTTNVTKDALKEAVITQQTVNNATNISEEKPNKENENNSTEQASPRKSLSRDDDTTEINNNNNQRNKSSTNNKEKKRKVKKVNASTTRRAQMRGGDERYFLPADGCVVPLNEDIQRRIIENQLHLLPPLARSGVSLFEDWATGCLEHELLLIEPYRRDEVQSLEFSSALLDLVSHNIPERIQAAALYVLSKFADDDTDAIKQQLLERGVERIFGLLKLHTPDFVQRDACELIAVLASGSEEIRESIIERFDALDTLIKKLSSKKSDDLRCAAARALTNLCYNDKYKEYICKQGVLPALLAFARQGKLQISKEIKLSQIQRGRLLGSGAFAKVYEGRYKGKSVAIKVFSESSFAFRLEDFYREVAIMSMISHPHVVAFEGACIEHKRDEEGVFMIVTELMQKGSLRDLIDKTYHGPLPIEKTLRYATHVALGMSYLHHFNVIHRDLKADNVLINQHDIAKIADLGLSREINIDHGMTIMAGTPKWEAPEVLANSKRKGDSSKTSRYSKEADVYSYGMTLYEMVSGLQPFAEIHDIFELKKAVCDKHKRPKIPPTCPVPLANLIKLCWHKDPAKRPSFDNILKSLEQIHKQLNIPFSSSTNMITSSSSPGPAVIIVSASSSSSSSSVVPQGPKK